MLKDIIKYLEEKLSTPNEESEGQHAGIQYATAALLIELARADFSEDDIERQLVIAMLRDTFELSEEELSSLIEHAETRAENANDLFQFTSLINDHLGNEEKVELVENLWRVAFADGRLDKYEEQFIRKVSGLIHLPPSEFVKTKLRIKDQLSG